MHVHVVLDGLAWLTSLAALVWLRRGWFANDATAGLRDLGYLAAVLFGAGIGAWLFGTLNMRLSGLDGFGRSIEGALVGAIAAVEIYKRQTGISRRTGAIYALPLMLGIAIGRIGCQLSGLEDLTYGIPTGADWGWDHGDGIKRHPVASYESAAMALFALGYGYAMMRGSPFIRANGFHLATGFYGVVRFGLEFLKPYGTLAAGLTLFQWLALGLVVYSVMMIRSRAWTPQDQS